MPALSDEQKTQVTQWIAEGASLGDVQKRLGAEFALSLTYMETRFLLDDLNLTVKDRAPKASPQTDLNKPAAPPPAGSAKGAEPIPFPGAQPAGPPSQVRISVDKIVRPGAVASGQVTFSDLQTADWYLDQTGRLGLVPKVKGYQPKPQDIQEFQYSLQDELAKLGY